MRNYFNKLIVIYSVILIILSTVIDLMPYGYACRGTQSEVRTFLTQLPPGSDQCALIAKVKVLNTQLIQSKRITKVWVIQAVKGVLVHTTFTIVTSMHSCARDPDIKPGQTYFVAGKLSPSGQFKGEWKGLSYIQGTQTTFKTKPIH